MEKKKIDRREFLKLFGAGAAAATAGIYGCGKRGPGAAAAVGEVPTDRMTFRTTPATGDRVSLLGYGCMRWPLLETPAADGNPIDQEAVNELVDYAVAHGVNYFDTAPVYVQGFSEKSTGIALKRHPREKVFVATKMSNFSNFTRENSLAMYRRSMAELQVDYLDYYLLHSVGGGKGVETFNERFIDNGVLDFLLREREAGRIRNLGWSFHGDRKVFDHLLAMHDRGEAVWDFVQIQMNYVDWKHAGGRNVNADYQQIYRRHILRAVEVAARKGPVQKPQRSGAPENRVHENPPPARKDQVGGVSEPDQLLPRGVELPQIGPDGSHGHRRTQVLRRTEQESQHGPHTSPVRGDLRGALPVAELPVAVVGRAFNPGQPLPAGQSSERRSMNEERDRSGQQADDSEKQKHDTFCFSAEHS